MRVGADIVHLHVFEDQKLFTLLVSPPMPGLLGVHIGHKFLDWRQVTSLTMLLVERGSADNLLMNQRWKDYRPLRRGQTLIGRRPGKQVFECFESLDVNAVSEMF